MWINPSKSLVDRALDRWSSTRLRADNTSVVTLMLDPPGPSRSEVSQCFLKYFQLFPNYFYVLSNDVFLSVSDQVLMSRKNERVPSPKSIATPLLCANAADTPTNNVIKPLAPMTTVLPSSIAPELSKNPDTSNVYQETPSTESTEIPPDKTTSSPGTSQEKSQENQKVIDETPDTDQVPTSTCPESIQVAEISSSNATDEINESSRIAEPKIDIVENPPQRPTSDNLELDTDVKSTESWSKTDDKLPTPVSSLTTDDDSLSEKCATSETTPLENLSGTELVRENAFCGSCQETKSRPRSRRTTNLPLTEMPQHGHEQKDSPAQVVVPSVPSVPSRRQSQGASLGSHLESRSVRRRRSVNAPTTCLGERQKSYFSSVGSRLKRDVPLGITRDRTIDSVDSRSAATPSSAERITMVGSKRRHSSTSEPVDESICGVQEPSTKRRTRSEDRPLLADENEPANDGKQQQQHSRLRWPEKTGSSSRSRSGSISGSSVGGQDKLLTPNSFQRRSLEKKATPVKTIRRPSINGSSRVQLRGSFALRDWDQTKSGHRNSCSDSRSRLNRTVGGTIGSADSSPAPSLQRWLRSDTLAAIPVKTLRSRNVDITGHTVPAQLAHQYGVVKQNRLSLPAKLKIAGKVNKPSSTLSSGKLTKQSPVGSGNVSTSSSTGSSSGITKRVKSPYNPSARSALGTRSRLKRLGK